MRFRELAFASAVATGISCKTIRINVATEPCPHGTRPSEGFIDGVEEPISACLQHTNTSVFELLTICKKQGAELALTRGNPAQWTCRLNQ